MNGSESTLNIGKTVSKAPRPIPVKGNERIILARSGQSAILSYELKCISGTVFISLRTRCSPRNAAIPKAPAIAADAIASLHQSECGSLRNERR